MTPYSPLFLLAALGVLSAAGTAAAQADTSQWKCESCPFPKSGVTGSVDAGVIYATDDSTTFGNYTGLPNKGAYLDLGGKVMYRGDDGYFADLIGCRPGHRHTLARHPGRARGPVRAAFRLRRDPALLRRGCENPVPGQRRQHA